MFRWNLTRQIEKEIDKIRDLGQPVFLGELDRWYVAPEPGKNGADVVLAAIATYVEPSGDIEDSLPIAGKAKLPPPNEPIPDDTLAIIKRYLDNNEKTLASLHELDRYDEYRYPIDLALPF